MQNILRRIVGLVALVLGILVGLRVLVFDLMAVAEINLIQMFTFAAFALWAWLSFPLLWKMVWGENVDEDPWGINGSYGAFLIGALILIGWILLTDFIGPANAPVLLIPWLASWVLAHLLELFIWVPKAVDK